MTQVLNRWILAALFAMVFFTGAASAGWWDPEWDYRKEILISNGGQELTDDQVSILLNASNFNFSHAAPGGADLRFTYYNSSTGLEQTIPFWIESWNASGDSMIWIKVPYIQNNGAARVYVYFGNAGASSASDGNSTFIFFDDFEGITLDINKWISNTNFQFTG